MRPIFLIGFMGCGKSTLGACLADVMAVPFIDLDDYIEQWKGMTVSELFSNEGESAFRRIEGEALRRVSCYSSVVVSCGGGTPCNADNIAWMNAMGTTVWLTASVDCLVARLLLPEQQAKRPLLVGLSHEALTERVTHMLAQRTPYYSQAQILFDATDIETAETCRATARRLALILDLEE